MRVQNVGIHAVEIYFPQTYISQEDLETYNKVGKGKYTIGLGQKEMAFVKSQEDVNSISLTAVKNLLEKYNIDPRQIGRLEIGTETLLDKSKSIKTVLMQLFKECGNHDIEGVTTINACYGGTAALFNSIAWVESSVWDGRYSIVLTTDVAVYKKGPARPTGGCGAVAMLIGPDAPISIETLRSTYIDHQYDFYKPDPRSEYPTVDGHVSINTYIGAIDNCYQGLKQKQANRGYEQINLNNVDYLCFHAPFGKMVQKAFLKLVHKDVLNGDLKIDEESLNVVKNEKYNSKPVQQILNKASQQIWKQKVLPSLAVGSRIGNIYTGSLYAGLVSLISDKSINLLGKRIFMFSYGSGLASSMFCFRVNRDISHIQYSLNTIERLNQRIKYDIQTFEDIMAAREAAFGTKNFKPQINFDELADGTYYLTEVDDMWRRVYQRKPVKWGKTVNIGNSQSVELSSTASSSQNPTTKVSPLAGEDVILNNAVDRLSALKSTMYQSKHVENRSIRNKSQSIWNGFYKKTLQERLDQLKKIDAEFNSDENLQGGLELQKADIMVENCVGKMALPMGLGLNFKMNDQEMQVPMVIEEPSVIAAASSAGKFIGSSGSGFNTCSTEPVMIGQVQLLDIATEEQIQSIRNNKDEIIEKANEACQSMVKRGGGVKDLRVRQLSSRGKNLKSTGLYTVDNMAVVDLFIDVRDSMGANIVNTICEHVSPFIQEISKARVGIKILSNLCTERIAFSEFKVPIKNMGWKGVSGEQVAQRMIESYRFAQLDPYRAVTHNKGIMNGIDAVALAVGQDWRSIEASSHAYASISRGLYQPISHYEIIEEQGQVYFKGSIELPISIGTKGGVIDNNKIYENNLRLLGYPNAQKMSEIMVTVGLAQNFAALRALAIEGIQKGHMSLHAKNIAIASGVPVYLAEDAARFMKKRGKVSSDIAKEYLLAYDLYGSLRKNTPKVINKKDVLSTFYVELNVPSVGEQLNLHIALDCTEEPIHISMEKQFSEIENKDIHNKLLGEKGYAWLQKMFESIDMVRLNLGQNEILPTKNIVPKLKLITIIIDLVTSNMIKQYPQITATVLKHISMSQEKPIKDLLSQQSDIVIKYGLSLLTELFRIFNYNIEQNTQNQMLKGELLIELLSVCQSQLQCQQYWRNNEPSNYFMAFFMQRKKRLCSTMMLLCDCLNLKENDVTIEQIQVLKELGGIYEIEITCVHDLQRWNPMNFKDDINVYTFWLRANDKINTALEKSTVEQFIQECKQIISQKKVLVQPKLNKRMMELCDTTSQVIRNHYKFDSNIFTQREIKQIKPKI